MKRVLVTGGAGTLGAAVVRRLLGDPDYEVRVSDQRAAPGVDARGLRGPPRRPARAARGAQGVLGLHARDPPRRDRRGPSATRTRSPRSTTRSRTRSCAPRSTRTSRASSTSARAPSTSAPRRSRPPRTTSGSARRRARPTASPSSPARPTAAPPPPSTACRYTICRPFNAYGPGGTDDAVIPDLIRKSLAGMSPLPIYGTRRADADLHAPRRRRRRHRLRDGAAGRRGRGVQHRLARGDLDRRARADLLGGVRPRPGGARARERAVARRRSTRSGASRRSRRRASCWGGRRRIGVEEGVAQTVEWLRDTEVAA